MFSNKSMAPIFGVVLMLALGFQIKVPGIMASQIPVDSIVAQKDDGHGHGKHDKDHEMEKDRKHKTTDKQNDDHKHEKGDKHDKGHQDKKDDKHEKSHKHPKGEKHSAYENGGFFTNRENRV